MIAEPNIVVFGGSFDPPHLGHQKLVQTVLERFNNARVLVVPAYQPVIDKTKEKVTSSGFEHRLAMTKLAFSEKGFAGKVAVSTIEESLARPSYSYRTLNALREVVPSQRFAFLIGDDQLKKLASWYEIKNLCSNFDFIVVRRDLKDLEKTLEEQAKLIGLDCIIQGSSWTWKNTEHGGLFIDEAVSEAKSSKIRAEIDAKASQAELSPLVSTYVNENKLYH